MGELSKTQPTHGAGGRTAAPGGSHNLDRMDFGVLLFLVVLTMLLTYPAVLHLNDRVIGGVDDNFQTLYGLWYVAHAIFDLHTSPFFDPAVYFPYGFDLIRNQDLSPATLLLFMPMTWAIGEVATYNLLVLLSFALTGWGTYLLALELWGSRAGALVASVIVGFCAFRVAHVVQLNIVSTQWIPFFFLFLERTIRRPDVRRAVLTGVFYALCSLVTWYYAFMTLIAAVLFLSVRLRWRTAFRLIPAGLIAATVALALVGPFALPYVRATRSSVMTERGWEEQQSFSATVADFFMPSVQHSVWGSWVQDHWRSGPYAWIDDWQIYLGVVALALAICALRSDGTRLTKALVCMAVGSLVLALGPTLYFLHPAALEGAEDKVPLSSIRMPVMLLGRLPPFTFLRAWARMGIFVQLAVGLLAARGLVLVLDRVTARFESRAGWLRPAILVSVMGLVLLENVSVPFPMSPVAPRLVDAWLAGQPGQFAVMEYPIPSHGYSASAMYSRRLTGKPIVMGYASYPPNSWAWETLSLFPTSETLDLLQRWNVKYVLVDEPLYQQGSVFWALRQTWTSLYPPILATERLKEVAVLDGVHVYELLGRNLGPLGSQILGNPGFENTSGHNPTDWVPLGTVTCDRSGENAREGTVACKVTDTQYFVSAPVSIKPRQCYQLRAFHRAANRTELLRLQINWLDDQQRELDKSTAVIQVVTADQRWSEGSAEFRAPDAARGAHVYAVAQKGEVWIDDYSLREYERGCTPTLVAVPNPVPISSGNGTSAIVWSTGDGSHGQLYVSMNGGPESLLSEGPSGRVPFASVTAGSRYDFHLYAGARPGTPRRTITVMALSQTGNLEATPNPVLMTGSIGSTTVSWDTGDGSVGQIFVSEDGAPERLFAEGPEGTHLVPWIRRGSRYSFRLYEGKERARMLHVLTVAGDAAPNEASAGTNIDRTP